jgi:hypothetical protein
VVGVLPKGFVASHPHSGEVVSRLPVTW